MILKILSCPICGAPGEARGHAELPDSFLAGCSDGECIAHALAFDFVSLETAVSAWNQRAPLPAVATLVPELTKPLELGRSYLTQAGAAVTIVQVMNDDLPGYECVQGDDPSENAPEGVWRYNRASDRGRVTGSAFDMSDPRNLIPELTELGKLQKHQDELRAQGGDLHFLLGDDPGTVEEMAAVANAMLAYKASAETPEQRHARYCEAANRGVDIGPDRAFIDSLLRGDHLKPGVFLAGLGDDVPPEWEQQAREAADRLDLSASEPSPPDWHTQMSREGWRVDPESGKTVNSLDPEAVWTGRPLNDLMEK